MFKIVCLKVRDIDIDHKISINHSEFCYEIIDEQW